MTAIDCPNSMTYGSIYGDQRDGPRPTLRKLPGKGWHLGIVLEVFWTLTVAIPSK